LAYTIQFKFGCEDKRDKVLLALQDRIAKDGKFKATLTPVCNGGWKGKFAPAIRVKPVRLVKARPYCGNHPNFCENPNRPKPNSTFLEWSDWVKFHSLVNRVLNRFRADADVWSNPPEIRGKMWIRKGKKARLHYDWTEDYSSGRRVQTWNSGDASQF